LVEKLTIDWEKGRLGEPAFYVASIQTKSSAFATAQGLRNGAPNWDFFNEFGEEWNQISNERAGRWSVSYDSLGLRFIYETDGIVRSVGVFWPSNQ